MSESPSTTDAAATTTMQDGERFVRLMRRYVLDYTNCGNQEVTKDLMEPDYILRMGDHVVTGRDTQYHAATAKQMTQFPGLGLTVHELVTSGNRTAMRFSEHGASLAHDGRECAWNGIALYTWNSRRLTTCYVEQDYWSRRRQLTSGQSNPVLGPAVAPWDTKAVAPEPAVTEIVRKWLEAGMLASTPAVILDDQWSGAEVTPLVDQQEIAIDDLFSCGRAVAFRVRQTGAFSGAPGFTEAAGQPSYIHATGIVHVATDGQISGHVVRNRLDLHRRLQAR